MFVQVIRGHTSDPSGLRRQMDRWETDLLPGAVGFLGSTGGITDDGEFVVLARFESEDAARTNSERAEQGEWWAETEKYFDASPSFRDSTDVELVMGGGSDDAGFVQVIESRIGNRARLSELDDESADQMPETRPDYLGSLRVWDGDTAIEVAYFTSEAAAREGEASDMPAEAASAYQEFLSLHENPTYLDLRDPILRTA